MSTEVWNDNPREPEETPSIFLNNCAISRLHPGSLRKLVDFLHLESLEGNLVLNRYDDIMARLHRAAGDLLHTSAANISLTQNTAEGMNLVANGYPFNPGDQVITYCHEYPSTYFPWSLQQQKQDIELVVLPNVDPTGNLSLKNPVAWSMQDLERLTTPRTRVVALSHTQFTSGYTADLTELSAFCQERNIDLVIDAAQSLGCLPVYPEDVGIAAIAASGWKWLLGPVGTGLLYTSPELREKLAITMAGPDMMIDGMNFLDLHWRPRRDGGRYEFSTPMFPLALALATSLTEIYGRYGIETISREVFRKRALALDLLDKERYQPIIFLGNRPSGFLAVLTPQPPQTVVNALLNRGVVMSTEGGYLRIAPHFYNRDEEIVEAMSILNGL